MVFCPPPLHCLYRRGQRFQWPILLFWESVDVVFFHFRWLSCGVSTTINSLRWIQMKIVHPKRLCTCWRHVLVRLDRGGAFSRINSTVNHFTCNFIISHSPCVEAAPPTVFQCRTPGESCIGYNAFEPVQTGMTLF